MAIAGEYLRRSGARDRYPGLTVQTSVRGGRVVVRLRAPLQLPLSIPGAPDTAQVGATGSALVRVRG